jgi:RNA polymerase sigma-70 factor (ECF subfamily)
MEEPLDTWFSREILAHEEQLMRFLTRVWPGQAEIADIRQEAYVRVYEAAQTARPLNARAFLFSTARHWMTDRIRRERIVSIQAAGDSEFLDVLVDELSPERRVSANQDLMRLARAFDRLPERYRRVLWFRRVKQISEKDTAHRMGLTSRTVEKYLGVALRLLGEHMWTSAALPLGQAAYSHEHSAGGSDHEHGPLERN